MKKINHPLRHDKAFQLAMKHTSLSFEEAIEMHCVFVAMLAEEGDSIALLESKKEDSDFDPKIGLLESIYSLAVLYDTYIQSVTRPDEFKDMINRTLLLITFYQKQIGSVSMEFKWYLATVMGIVNSPEKKGEEGERKNE